MTAVRALARLGVKQLKLYFMFGLPTEEEYVAAYCRRVGRPSIPQWNYYVAFSLFRLAAIAQGVYRRGLQGNSSNPESVKMSRSARERAELAWSLAS